VTVVLPALEWTWEPADVALYHLGIGAGTDDLEGDLDLLLEDRLQPLPTFAALACFPTLIHLDQLPGLEGIDLALVLHAEHEIVLEDALPASGRVRSEGVVEAIADKARGALVRIRQESRSPSGALAWTNRYSMFLRGSGPRGDDAAPAPLGDLPPERAPDAELAQRTAPWQSLLYRHAGDDNPLHLDPDYARRGGFDEPILQGLCSLGFAVRGIVAQPAGLPAHDVRRVAARFTGAVAPGEELCTSVWTTPSGAAFVTATAAGAPVLGRGVVGR
jgi:acyl dehydratase